MASVLPHNALVRHQSAATAEKSTCGHRFRLISEGDQDVAAWAHTVDMDGSKAHYHKVTTELYYVVEGEGTITLDGVEEPIQKGSIVHIPPGVVHSSKGTMRVLVVGIPDIKDSDVFYPDDN